MPRAKKKKPEQDLVIVSPSRLSTWGTCQRKYYYQYVRRWRTGSGPASVFGSAWHEAMDVVWQMGTDSVDAAEALTAGFESFCAAWEDNKGIGGKWDSDFRSPDIARDMLDWYIYMHYAELKWFELLEVESAFAKEVSGRQELFGGRMDKVYRDKRDGMVYVLDHKTTSAYSVREGIKASWWKQFYNDDQIDGYLWYARQVYGADVGGIVIDGALVHKEKRAFKRDTFNKGSKYLQSWELSVAERMQTMFDKPVYSKNVSACSMYGGCAFREVCAGAPRVEDVPEQMPDDLGIVLDMVTSAERLGISRGGKRGNKID